MVKGSLSVVINRKEDLEGVIKRIKDYFIKENYIKVELGLMPRKKEEEHLIDDRLFGKIDYAPQKGICGVNYSRKMITIGKISKEKLKRLLTEFFEAIPDLVYLVIKVGEIND